MLKDKKINMWNTHKICEKYLIKKSIFFHYKSKKKKKTHVLFKSIQHFDKKI